MAAVKVVVTPKHFGNKLIGTSPVTVCVFPAGISTVRTVHFTNTTDSPVVSVKAWACIVPPGESAGKMNAIAWGHRIFGGGEHQDDGIHEVDAGGSVVAWCDTPDGFCIIVDGAVVK